MASNIEALLTWVLVDGVAHHVEEYRHLKPKERPIAYCPVCKQQVIMKLGEIRVFHAAHKVDDICAVTRPETALHLNAKLHIAEQLQKNKPLIVRSNCSGYDGNPCLFRSVRITAYFMDWDEVLVEYNIEQYRPDIVLRKDGKAVGAIEVFVTHAIEPEKEQLLKTLSIPWVEVDAQNILPAEENKVEWLIDEPLEYRKINTAVIQKWICEDCKVDRLKKKRERARAIPEPPERPYQFQITAIRMIDYYYPDEKQYRAVYYARKCLRNGQIIRKEIVEKNNVICSVSIRNDVEDNQELVQKFDEFIKGKATRGVLLDLHMRWQKVQEEIKLSTLLDDSWNSVFPRRRYWSERDRKWYFRDVMQSIDWNGYFVDGDKYKRTLSEKRQEIDRKNEKRKSAARKIQDTAPHGKEVEERPNPVLPEKYSSPLGLKNPAYECVHCHRITIDYWWCDNSAKTCRCRDCLREGKD